MKTIQGIRFGHVVAWVYSEAIWLFGPAFDYVFAWRDGKQGLECDVVIGAT